MSRRYFGWTTTHFGKHGGVWVNHYRRYGKKTYRTGRWRATQRERSIINNADVWIKSHTI